MNKSNLEKFDQKTYGGILFTNTYLRWEENYCIVSKDIDEKIDKYSIADIVRSVSQRNVLLS